MEEMEEREGFEEQEEEQDYARPVYWARAVVYAGQVFKSAVHHFAQLAVKNPDNPNGRGVPRFGVIGTGLMAIASINQAVVDNRSNLPTLD